MFGVAGRLWEVNLQLWAMAGRWGVVFRTEKRKSQARKMTAKSTDLPVPFCSTIGLLTLQLPSRAFFAGSMPKMADGNRLSSSLV
jgi:hypothetical protein